MNIYNKIKLGWGTIDPSAVIDIESVDGGALFPRMVTVSRDAIVNPATSLFIYNMDTGTYQYHNGSAWVDLATGGGTGNWTFSGDLQYPNSFKEKILQIPYTYKYWGDPTLVVGQKYYIVTYDPSSDFTNVGAPNNNVGTSFYATGTTPTVFGSQTYLYSFLLSEGTLFQKSVSNAPFFEVHIYQAGKWNGDLLQDDWNALFDNINALSFSDINISDGGNGRYGIRIKPTRANASFDMFLSLSSLVPTPSIIPNSGIIIFGEVYEIINYYGADDFTNIGAPSNAQNVIFRTTGTVPNDWTSGSYLKTYRTLPVQIGSSLVVGEVYEVSSYNPGDDFTNVGGTNTLDEFFVATGTTPTTWLDSNLNLVRPHSNSYLTIGETYEIFNYVASDDFTNIGAVSNVTGEVFVATGTVPTLWVNSTSLIHRFSTLEIGATYEIVTYVPGDDFTNVGAVSNTVGQKFIAIGTTPTSWAWNTNGSILNKTEPYTVDSIATDSVLLQQTFPLVSARFGDNQNSPDSVLGNTIIRDGLVIGANETGGYVATRDHAVQILAHADGQAAITAIGGGSLIQLWKDESPTLGASIGLGIPGNAPDYNFHISRWSPGWVSALTVDSATGCVGIGMTSPTSAIHIGTLSGSDAVTFVGGGATKYFGIEDTDSGPGSALNINAGGGTGIAAYGGSLILSGGTSQISTGGDAIIDGGSGTPNGNVLISASIISLVGIGTISPSSKVDIDPINAYEQLRLRATYTPAATNDANGNIGDVAWDRDFLYIKTDFGGGQWGRIALDYNF